MFIAPKEVKNLAQVSTSLIVLVLVVVLDFDRYWLGERKAARTVDEASVGIALASRSRKSRTRTSHLSWSVNIFYKIIHHFIHRFRGVFRG